MAGERDLKRLIRGMDPVLDPRDWGYALAPAGAVPAWAWAVIREDEGATLIAPLDDLSAAGIEASGPWSRITLMVHSALEAVGLTAAIATALAAQGISANVVAGWHHDHVFLPKAQASAALDALRSLAQAG